MSLARCSSCAAPILWVEMVPSRKRMPVDLDPSPEGTVEVKRGRRDKVKLYGRVVGIHERDGSPLFISHFATCPKARQHRRQG